MEHIKCKDILPFLGALSSPVAPAPLKPRGAPLWSRL
jgi:hypothetical protein